MADEEETAADVTVVNVDTGGDDEGSAPVIVAPDQSDPWPTIATHGERLTALELALEATNRRVDEVGVSADVAAAIASGAGETAEMAVEIAAETAGEVETLAVETEEAVAAVAQEAEAATDEVIEEVEEIAPSRTHAWFKKRSILKERS